MRTPFCYCDLHKNLYSSNWSNILSLRATQSIVGAITAFKIISIAFASIVWAASCGHTLADLTPIMESNVAVAGLLYTGLITTAAALWVQSYAFEEVTFLPNLCD